MVKPEHRFVLHHLVVTGQIFASGGRISNSLLHPSVRQAVHSKYEKIIKDELKWCHEHVDNAFEDELEKEYLTIAPIKFRRIEFEAVYSVARYLILNDEVKVLIMNGKTKYPVMSIPGDQTLLLVEIHWGEELPFLLSINILYQDKRKTTG